MMILVLRLMCGGFWMISYSIAIYKGIKEKSYAMPFFSLCLNISWEMLYFKKVINGGDGGLIWIIIDSIWLILDAGILITYFLYGKKYYPDKLKKYFWGFSIFQLIIAMLIMNEFYTTYPFHAKINAGFFINIVMSMLFIDMLVKRNGKEGQSIILAITKFIGTLATTTLSGFCFGAISRISLVLGGISAILDIMYIYLLIIWDKKEEGKK